MALIFAIVALCSKSKCLAITAIVIGALCIVLAIVFWIVLIAMLVRKASLENTYCPVLKTACCSGTYISSQYGYYMFTCQSSTCRADPLSNTVSSSCSGSYSLTVNAITCTGSSSCNGVADGQANTVCNSCSDSIICSSITTMSASGNYCK